MLTARGETYELQLFKRVENSAYEYEDKPSLYFRGRPANQYEKRNYRLMTGVEANTDSVYVVCSNLPDEVKVKDRVWFLGKIWTIESIGAYFDNNKLVNGAIFSNEYLLNRSPKGLTLA